MSLPAHWSKLLALFSHPVPAVARAVLGRRIDLVDHGGAKQLLDHDTRHDAVSLVGLFGQAEGVLDDAG